MVDNVVDSGIPVESYVDQDNQQAYWSLVESLTIKELWSRQVEGLECFKKVYCPPQWLTTKLRLLWSSLSLWSVQRCVLLKFPQRSCHYVWRRQWDTISGVAVKGTQIFFPNGVAIMLGFPCFGKFGNTKRWDNIRTTFRPQDLALLGPERDLSI